MIGVVNMRHDDLRLGLRSDLMSIIIDPDMREICDDEHVLHVVISIRWNIDHNLDQLTNVNGDVNPLFLSGESCCDKELLAQEG